MVLSGPRVEREWGKGSVLDQGRSMHWLTSLSGPGMEGILEDCSVCAGGEGHSWLCLRTGTGDGLGQWYPWLALIVLNLKHRILGC